MIMMASKSRIVALMFSISNVAWAFSPTHASIKLRKLQTPHRLEASPICQGFSIRDSWAVIALGDLHMEDDMSTHEQARADCLIALKDLSLLPSPPKGSTSHEIDISFEDIMKELVEARAGNLSVEQLEMLLARRRDGDLCKRYLVSLGDLGRKDIRHAPGDAGTTKSFQDARDFMNGFGLPYELVSGNHDLEGLDEFETDKENLDAWLDCFAKETPHFSRLIGEKTLLIGLSTTRFRDAPHSSHEVHIDDAQLEWFVKTVEAHRADEGWKLLVFSHAPIMGSGLRVLQSVHVTNGCAWLNHCSESRNLFIRTVKNNPQIKMWFSGHFHLSHDYEDAISRVGSCTFVQVGVMGPASSRDGRRQTRVVQGCSDKMKIYSVNHHVRDSDGKAEVRLDVEIDLKTDEVTYAHGNQDVDHEDWFQAYIPRQEDGCYIDIPDGSVADAGSVNSKVCWWHMADGKVLGLHQGQLIEYDAETLSPLGVVVTREKLGDREVVVVQDGTALVLAKEATTDIEVIHPNDDGSYWRKFQRNKKLRQAEKAREEVARMWMKQKH